MATKSTSPIEARLRQKMLLELSKDDIRNKVKLGTRSPAKLRALSIDTHDRLPAAGVSKPRAVLYSPKSTLIYRPQLSTKGAVTLGHFGPEEPHQHDMSHANKLALLAYSKRAHSEWALLDKQEAQLEQLAAQQRAAYLATLKGEQRQVLDGQMQEKLQAKVQQQQEKVQAAEQLAAALKQHQLDDARQAAAKREAAMKTKALMAGQVAEYRRNKQELRQAKREEEQAELDELQGKQDEEDAKKAQRLHDDRVAMHKTLAENDENIKAKKRAAKQQALEDDEMMRQYAVLLHRQDTAREAALLALQARTALRAEVAGAEAKHAKDEHHAAEDARINAAVAEADRKAQEAAEKLAAKRRAMQQECDKARKAQMQRKAQQQAADAQEDLQFMQSLSTREAELAELERAHQAALRSHNQKLKLELERQIAEREEREVNHDTSMTAAERKLNATALRRAVSGGPSCCVCGQCRNCCSWQQAKQKMNSSSKRP